VYSVQVRSRLELESKQRQTQLAGVIISSLVPCHMMMSETEGRIPVSSQPPPVLAPDSQSQIRTCGGSIYEPSERQEGEDNTIRRCTSSLHHKSKNIQENQNVIEGKVYQASRRKLYKKAVLSQRFPRDASIKVNKLQTATPPPKIT